MPFILALLVGVVFSLVVIEVLAWFIMGPLLKERTFERYLGKYWEEIRLNSYENTGKLLSGLPKYLSASSPTPLSRWSIQDFGRIPRWSKWSKELDKKRAELMLKDGLTKELNEL